MLFVHNIKSFDFETDGRTGYGRTDDRRKIEEERRADGGRTDEEGRTPETNLYCHFDYSGWSLNELELKKGWSEGRTAWSHWPKST